MSYDVNSFKQLEAVARAENKRKLTAAIKNQFKTPNEQISNQFEARTGRFNGYTTEETIQIGKENTERALQYVREAIEQGEW